MALPKPKIQGPRHQVVESKIKAPGPGTPVKLVQMLQAVDLLGSKKSLRPSHGHYLVHGEKGVLAVSEASQRAVLIPWDNIGGCEYALEHAIEITPPKKDAPNKG